MKDLYAYLNFDGNCRQAMTFYEKCLGAELQMMPFEQPEQAKDRIMHARLSKGSMRDRCPGYPARG